MNSLAKKCWSLEHITNRKGLPGQIFMLIKIFFVLHLPCLFT